MSSLEERAEQLERSTTEMSFFEERARVLEAPTEPDQQRFRKTVLFTGEGERYEERCAAVLLLRCLREGLHFRLSANDAAAGRFDDLVLHWQSGDSPSGCALFVQLRYRTPAVPATIHRSSLLGEGRSWGFCIKRYYESYKSIRETLNGGTYALVLYTNVDLDEDAQDMFERRGPESIPWLQLLETGGSCYSLKPDHKGVMAAVLGDAHDEYGEYGEFAQHFYLLSSQSDTRTMKSHIHTELNLLLGADDSSCVDMCRDLCESIRDWMNTQDFYLTSKWSRWLTIVETYIQKKVSSSDSLVTGIKYTRSCVETLESHIRGRHLAWVRPPSQEATPLTATKVQQAICGEAHIVVSASHFPQLQDKIMRCWGRFCRWLVLVDDANTLRQLADDVGQHVGQNRRVIIVSYWKSDASFQDTCESGDIEDESWNALTNVAIKLTSEQRLCCLSDLCDTAALKETLDGKPKELVALLRLSDAGIVLLKRR